MGDRGERVNVYLPPAQKFYLQQRAHDLSMGLSELVRKIIREEMEREPETSNEEVNRWTRHHMRTTSWGRPPPE